MDVIQECNPLHNNKELLNFYKTISNWNNLFEEIVPRCLPRILGTDFSSIKTENVIIEFEDNNSHPKVLVCHDLAGNYRNDRFVKDTPKWDDYRFYSWSGIDIFCYFSHHYVTIPPSSWINAAHKNGVKMIGTFITESGKGKQLLEEVLTSVTYMQQVAEALVLISKVCKFEGWLMNIECTLDEYKTLMLRDFVAYLTQRMHEEVPNGIVIWYDSIIKTGALSWQNELNHNNRMFFDACDGIFLNYTWNDSSLINTTEAIAESMNRHREQDVFVGIDVFGRGQQARFHTNETLAKIKQYNFSVAIFAPGWTYETTPDVDINSVQGNELCNYKFIMRNDFFWCSLWKYFYTQGPMVLPFYSSFCVGSGKVKRRCGAIVSDKPWFNLSKQEYQPSIPTNTVDMIRNFDDSFDGGSCIEILNKSNKQIRLFVCDFITKDGIIISYALKRKTENIDLEFLLSVINHDNGKQCLFVCSEYLPISKLLFGNRNNEKHIPSLKDPLLKMTLMRLQETEEKFLPKTNPINDWEIRFFYLNFDPNINGRITDIGFRIKEMDTNLNLENETILLGAISIHNGVLFNDDLSNIDKIDAEYFM